MAVLEDTAPQAAVGLQALHRFVTPVGRDKFPLRGSRRHKPLTALSLSGHKQGQLERGDKCLTGARAVAA